VKRPRGLPRGLGLGLALSLVCTPALADPALWVLHGPTATIYLFGTVHVLPKDAHWHYPALDRALAACDTLYVEEDDDAAATIRPLVLKYGIDTSHTLASRLDPADKSRLESAAEGAGLPGGEAALESMKPWLAAVTLTVAPIIKAGYDPQSGADRALQREFKGEGKPIAAFETAEKQLRFLADLPQPLQLDLLRSTLDDYTRAPQVIAALIQHWEAGDVAAIARVVNADMRARYPRLYGVLLVDRNRAWARKIKALLQRHATIFVAVGAGHLAGPDSVQVQLRKLGIDVERVQ
jgi:uncharacterized protein